MEPDVRSRTPIATGGAGAGGGVRPAGGGRGFRVEPDDRPGGPQRGFRAPPPEDPAPAATGAGPARDTGSSPTTPPPTSARWRWASLAAVLVVAMGLIAVLGFRAGATSTQQPSAGPAASPTATTTATTLAVADVYTRIAPSVVLITTSKGSLGSGTVVTATGTVLTANHVVSGGGAVTVVFSDGTRAPATVATTDPSSDIATLTPQKLPEVVVPATLGGGVRVGADVVAVGNPLGLRDSTTAGVVSGLDRTEKTDAGRISGLIQFDAAVNPGSSGGPLLDAQGSVVGVVVSIADPGGDDAFAGIGFAVPIAAAVGGGSGDGPGGGPQI
ncbi:S1C family serine protease [Nakamurella endophytica]|uniref:Trypsin-like peptidase n=1 Tax=Nakamurella endophytica TaxID=1748367 RepID=A0A917SW26_9ACTN|nr:trypsin-like peptidase domain-containing protein [Nakamurella endophytica]GGL98781.1 hypothetical protein GCM10011594_18350 [Nakamurella endophytica]